jgi:hypothetical protein
MAWRLAGTSFAGAAVATGVAPSVEGPTTKTVQNVNGSTATVCQPVYVFGSGTIKLARANAAATAIVAGLVHDATIANNASGEICTSGPMTKTTAQWDAQTGQSGGLTAGAEYWCSAATAGKLTTTPPSAATQFDVRVGIALSTTIMLVGIAPPIGPL